MRATTTTTNNEWNLPRTISGKLKLTILFGNVMFSLGLVFFLFGSIFVIVFGANTDFTSTFAFKDTDPVVRGVIVHVEETNSRENKTRIYHNTYNYSVNGKVYTSDAYSLGPDVSPLDSVDVQYTAADPSLSVIPGMRKAPFEMWVLFMTLLFPMIGLVFLLVGLRRSRKNIRLLQTGLHGHGKVTRKEATSTKINKQTVYKVYFSFTTKDGMLTEGMVKTHKPALVEDEEKEQLVYDATNPSDAVLIDTLPKAVRRFLENNT
jgi:hypothetical protein